MRSLIERGSDDWGSWEWFQDGRAKGFAAGVASQREADAALVEAADCPCADLARLNEIEWGVDIDYRADPPVVTKHADCCPIALAEQIRRRQ